MNRNLGFGVGIALTGVLVILLVSLFSIFQVKEGHIHKGREKFISQKNEIVGELTAQGKYTCCLEKPCTYCIEKHPKHGEGATCTCLEDVVTGKHPCGECIGEILEGHGNPYLAEYFAKAIAEKPGQEGAIKEIIEEKYGIPADKQV